MKEEILDIAKLLYHNLLTPETATNLLLDLFPVNNQTESLKAFSKWYEQNYNFEISDEAINKFCDKSS